MTRPDDLFEAASYDLNKFRERRMAERRSVPRDTADRRNGSSATQAKTQSPPSDRDGQGSGTTH